jgi:hypothetical protein
MATIGESPDYYIERAAYTGAVAAMATNPVAGVTFEVYNSNVPDDPAYPYVVLGEVREHPNETKTNWDWIFYVPFFAYSNAPSKKEVRAAVRALTKQFLASIEYPLNTSDYHCWLIRQRYARNGIRQDKLGSGFAGWSYSAYLELELRVSQLIRRQ